MRDGERQRLPVAVTGVVCCVLVTSAVAGVAWWRRVGAGVPAWRWGEGVEGVEGEREVESLAGAGGERGHLAGVPWPTLRRARSGRGRGGDDAAVGPPEFEPVCAVGECVAAFVQEPVVAVAELDEVGQFGSGRRAPSAECGGRAGGCGARSRGSGSRGRGRPTRAAAPARSYASCARPRAHCRLGARARPGWRRTPAGGRSRRPVARRRRSHSARPGRGRSACRRRHARRAGSARRRCAAPPRAQAACRRAARARRRRARRASRGLPRTHASRPDPPASTFPRKRASRLDRRASTFPRKRPERPDPRASRRFRVSIGPARPVSRASASAPPGTREGARGRRGRHPAPGPAARPPRR